MIMPIVRASGCRRGARRFPGYRTAVRRRDRSSSILAIRTSVSNDMEPDPSVRLLTDWFQPPRVGEGRRGASRSFLSRDGRAHLDNRFAEIAAFEHADKRLGRIGKTLGDILPR